MLTEKGVIEKGTYQQLIDKTNVLYNRLYKTQFNGAIKDLYFD